MTTDRTRAIVDAAERLEQHLHDVAESRTVGRNANLADVVYAVEHGGALDGALARENVRQLLLALALPAEPAPAWTRTPPTADGHYWIRGFGAYGVARVLEGSAMFPGLTRRYDLDALSVEHEFWPVRLQEPPA